MRSEILDRALVGLGEGAFRPFAGKRVVVTGATGFVGSLVCKALLLADVEWGIGCSVVAVSRDAGRARSVLEGYDLGDASYVEADFSARAEIGADGADFVLHAAAVTRSREMVERPADVIAISLNGTGAALSLARRTGARMVYISSMEAYGTLPEGEVADESALGWIDLSSPRSCYPESKRMCECLCNAHASQHGVRVCSARLAQAFGAGVLPGEGRAFAQFARAAMRGEDIVLRTRGLSEGNYVNSVDCVAGLLALLARGEAGSAYNVADERAHGTILEVAGLASEVLGGGRSRVVVDPDESNSAGYAPDVHLRLSSARLRALGWAPKTSLAGSFLELGAYMEEQGLV